MPRAETYVTKPTVHLITPIGSKYDEELSKGYGSEVLFNGRLYGITNKKPSEAKGIRSYEVYVLPYYGSWREIGIHVFAYIKAACKYKMKLK